MSKQRQIATAVEFGHAFGKKGVCMSTSCLGTSGINLTGDSIEVQGIIPSVHKSHDFGNWFLNLSHLLMSNIAIYETAMHVSFPHLKHLALKKEIYNLDYLQYLKQIDSENSVKFLHANQQLQSFEIDLPMPIKLSQLLNIISENSCILKLVLGSNLFARKNMS